MNNIEETIRLIEEPKTGISGREMPFLSGEGANPEQLFRLKTALKQYYESDEKIDGRVSLKYESFLEKDLLEILGICSVKPITDLALYNNNSPNIKGNETSDIGQDIINAIVKNLPQLRSLKIIGNIDPKSFKSLCNGISNNTTLRTLTLEDGACVKDSVSDLINAAYTCPSLEDVNLPNNNLDDQDCNILAGFILKPSCKTRTISLYGNKNITEHGAIIVIDAMRKNPALTFLEFGGHSTKSPYLKIITRDILNDVAGTPDYYGDGEKEMINQLLKLSGSDTESIKRRTDELIRQNEEWSKGDRSLPEHLKPTPASIAYILASQAGDETVNESLSSALEVPNKDADVKNKLIPSMDDLIGLSNVKSKVHLLTQYVAVNEKRKQHGLKVAPLSLHMVFTGNPGTGKTTVAKYLGQALKEAGVLTKGHVVEAKRDILLSEFIGGGTAMKTKAKIHEAHGGILFIDEAYSITEEHREGYGKEAITTLLTEMDGEHRNDFIVIVAGYEDKMTRFLQSNDGLESRFPFKIHFDDYTPDELVQIFKSFSKSNDYQVTQDAIQTLQRHFADAVKGKELPFSNGRYVRNVFESTVLKQSSRLGNADNVTKDMLTEITPFDLSFNND